MSEAQVSDLVKAAIARKGLTTVDAANLCSIPEKSMYAITSGERGRRPFIPTLQKLAAGLDIPLDDLLLAAGRIRVADSGVEATEKNLLLLWRSLSERDQQLALGLMQRMRNQP